MCTNECKTLLHTKPSIVVLLFQHEQQRDSHKLLDCFYTCCRSLFFKSAAISYGHQYDRDLIEFISANSFSEAILLFSEHARVGKLYDGSGSLKTILFQYFYNKLRGNLKTEKRLQIKKRKFNFDNQIKEFDIEDDIEPSAEIRYSILEKALERMRSQDRQIIIWRHFEKKTVSEIADLLNIDYGSASNRIFRCMKRIKGIIKNEMSYNNE